MSWSTCWALKNQLRQSCIVERAQALAAASPVPVNSDIGINTVLCHCLLSIPKCQACVCMMSLKVHTRSLKFCQHSPTSFCREMKGLGHHHNVGKESSHLDWNPGFPNRKTLDLDGFARPLPFHLSAFPPPRLQSENNTTLPQLFL